MAVDRSVTNKLLDEGQELFKKYCEGEDRPLMLPPAPSQQRIDVYEGSL